MGLVRRLPFMAVILITLMLIVWLPVGLLALALGFGLLPLPYDLFIVLQRLPVAFPLHMIASGAALILIPIAVFVRRRHGLHRTAGRAAAAAALVGAITALLVALASEANTIVRAGLFAQGVVWLALVTTATVAIRHGKPRRHARLMMAMAAVASGAIWLRLALSGGRLAPLSFEQVYAIAAWVCWLLPLAIVLAVTRPRPAASGRLGAVAPSIKNL